MNLWSIISDFIIVTFLGLFIAFSPMLVIVNLLIVLKSKKPITHALALIIGIISPLILVALLGFHFIQPDSSITIRAISDQIKIPPFIDILFGLSLCGLAGRFAIKSQRTKQKPHPTTIKVPNDKVSTLYAFGFMKSLLSATNLFAILVVVKIIITSSLNPVVNITILLWTILVGMVPFIIVLYYHRFRNDYLIHLNQRLNEILAKNLQSLLIITLYVSGAFFLIHGLFGLLR